MRLRHESGMRCAGLRILDDYRFFLRQFCMGFRVCAGSTAEATAVAEGFLAAITGAVAHRFQSGPENGQK